MLTLKKFTKSHESNGDNIVSTRQLASKSVNAVLTTASVSTVLGPKSTEICSFSDELAQKATSDEVLDELSSKVGTPKTNESEDEFVKRASEILHKILSKKMGL